jgi:hypothetical protein
MNVIRRSAALTRGRYVLRDANHVTVDGFEGCTYQIFTSHPFDFLVVLVTK